MRTLMVRTLNLLLRFRAGRWIATIVFLLAGLLLLLDSSAAGTDTTTALVTGAVALLIGLVLLFFTIRLELLLHHNKQAAKTRSDRAKELAASGKMMPIPRLPQTPLKGASADDLMTVERYAMQMADLPWGAHPTIATVEEAYPLFNQTVARVREVTGDWRAFARPIDIFVAMPRPLCHIGAAEIMLRLSYLRERTWAPVGLQRGLYFVAEAQFEDPEQPDALVIRIKLLAGYANDHWLHLAEDTLEALKKIAPDHLRLPNAEAQIHAQRGRLEEALACVERTLANPPSQEEVHVALLDKARLLVRMQRTNEALAAYDVLNQRYPQDPWSWHNKSLLLLNLERYQEALACNERALSIMNFNAARSAGERIRAKLAEAQNLPR